MNWALSLKTCCFLGALLWMCPSMMRTQCPEGRAQPSYALCIRHMNRLCQSSFGVEKQLSTLPLRYC